MNSEKLELELSYINDNAIRDSVREFIDKHVPDYFFHVAASSTGKYHPEYATGEGGLLRHTQAAVRIAAGMFAITKYSNTERDIIIAALILHDTFKHGLKYTKYTCADHPVIAYKQVLEHMTDCPYYMEIADAILTHMGQWNRDYRTKREIMPKPQTAIQKYVHTCDYLASRKYLEFKFDVDVEVR
jgi:hypothetical protein